MIPTLPIPGGGLTEVGLGGALLAAALGATAGVRVFLAPFVCGLVALLSALDGGGSGWAASPWVAVAAGGLLLVELGADKVHGLDQALDAAGIVFRPLWAGALTLILAPGAPFAWAVTAGALACALGIGKARLRIEARAAFADSSVRGAVGPALSLAEDVAAAALVLGALAVPVLTLVSIAAGALFVNAIASSAKRRRWLEAAAA